MSLLLVIFGLALVDSINPTAIALAAIIMLTRRRWVCSVASFVLGESLVYLGVGVAALLGFSAVGDTVREYWYSPGAYVVEGLVGVGLLIYSFLAPSKPRKERDTADRGLVSLFVLGMSIAVVEFATALPYFAAIGLLIREDVQTWASLVTLLAYNVVMFLPILALGLAYSLLPASTGERMNAFVERNRGKGRDAMLWVVGIVGALLVADAVRFFLVREFVPIAG